MNPVIEFFQKLLDTNDWPPRWYCGNWTDFHGWLYIFSDLAIWSAYMAIPLILIRFIILKQGIPLRSVFWLFGAFILLCGLTHLVDATMFWWPAYRFNAFIRFLTGIVSFATVLALIKYFDQALGLRTSGEYERELNYRQRAVQELSRSNEELQQFAYVASHDLQSPLRTIENYMSLLEQKHGHELSPDARKLLEVTSAASGRMRVLINDLLEFSRIGNTADFVPVDLNTLFEEIMDEQQEDIRDAGADIQVGRLPVLEAHRTDLKQLFLNLLSNSIKYRRTGVTPVVSVQAEDAGDNWQIRISDNGIGIDARYYDRIFQLFQRLHGRNEFPGTGIGLATCKKVVEIYGGRIWLESKVNEGSTFYVVLPKVIKTLKHYAQSDTLHSVN
ncbi:sensor histidine kinase [Arsenicibacter rosenii]|uniref:histidine kinase n=1 Tax=Arsenicibacter rosenii TaxID=1750698 RepID=A0A1S2VQ96_9BACT|nr:ATP-binding protein [Arsenicibacter rosenii]OIN60953.1 two-component sensor histidine kinase [Arsenicibacter rosenii]